jgi:glutamate-1-semialdehyde 2,1-aminomutase
MPCAVFGFTDDVERGMRRVLTARGGGHTGMGTTLAANALAVDCLRACLAEVMTEANHAQMNSTAIRLADALQDCFTARDLRWQVSRVGARIEFGFGPAPGNGTAAEAATRPALEHALHLWLLNRGFLITPFHNMMLVAPVTRNEQVDALVDATAAVLEVLAGELPHG